MRKPRDSATFPPGCLQTPLQTRRWRAVGLAAWFACRFAADPYAGMRGGGESAGMFSRVVTNTTLRAVGLRPGLLAALRQTPMRGSKPLHGLTHLLGGWENG